MTPEKQRNMYEVRELRNAVDEIIKPAFNTGQSVKEVKIMLYNLLFDGVEGNNIANDKINEV